MPDLPGLIVGGGSLVILVLLFIYCEDFSNGNVERMEPPAPKPENESSRGLLPSAQPAE